MIILSLVPPKRSHSAAAQGGMQASLANVIKGQGDTEDVHFEDTVRGSDWGADQKVVRMFVNTAPKAVRELAAWGVPWSRVRKGDRTVIINGQKVTITERDEAHGLVAQRDFGGTKKWRTCYVSDGTGHAMLQTMSDQAIGAAIPVHERTEAIALIHDGGRCYGAIVRNLITGELVAYVAKATAIASGGAGRLYRVTTNAVICEGIGSAHRAGDRRRDARQHGSRAVPPDRHLPGRHPRHRRLPRRRRPAEGRRRPPLHARLRAREEGARLARRRVAGGWRSTSPRARARRAASAITSGSTSRCWARSTSSTTCAKSTRSATTSSASIPTKDWIPVRPAQHYTMGGVRTNHTGESPTLKGLFAAGEAACWDMHGFNRLGGNSVAETVVAGMIVGEYIADFCDRIENDVDIPTGAGPRLPAARAGEARRARSTAAAPRTRRRSRRDAGDDDREGRHLPPRRGPAGGGRRAAAAARAEPQHRRCATSARGANPELVTAYRVQKMLKVALCVAYGALTRTESRGAHFRQDFPRRNDAEWLKRTLATWKGEADTLPSLAYEALDVNAMELPPGWRGYGAKDYVDHPDTPKRAAEVEAMKQKMAGAPRFAVQEALMPYERPAARAAARAQRAHRRAASTNRLETGK